MGSFECQKLYFLASGAVYKHLPMLSARSSLPHSFPCREGKCGSKTWSGLRHEHLNFVSPKTTKTAAYESRLCVQRIGSIGVSYFPFFFSSGLFAVVCARLLQWSGSLTCIPCSSRIGYKSDILISVRPSFSLRRNGLVGLESGATMG